MNLGPLAFAEIVLVDFEFAARPGERPDPICMVARSLVTGVTQLLWRDELVERSGPPYPTDESTLFIAYYASAEISCHLALGWPVPVNVLDLFVEFRNRTNGLDLPCGRNLLGALAFFGLDSITASAKDNMRDLALRGGPWTPSEQKALLEYCESDVDALGRLLPRLLPSIDVPRALNRGRYMIAAARMEMTGVPIDVEAHTKVVRDWDSIKGALISRIDTGYNVYENGIFKRDRFATYLAANNIPWPLLHSGQPQLDDDTFREMSRAHPEVAPLRELRASLSQLRLSDLGVGADGRSRCMLSAFQSRTGRNQPSTTQFVFGLPVWLRSLIRPGPGRALAYLDWSQQEFGIAAALSADDAMLEAYLSGDPYLAFAKQAGAVPATATKQTHPAIRDQFKACALAVQYGMEEASLGQRIGQPPSRARELLRLHRETYHRFWRWSDACQDHALLHGHIHTAFGWRLLVGLSANPRSIRNFPMQANGAEMLRIACCLATEAGIAVCAPVHDAVLIEGPLEEIEAVVERAQRAMAEASRVVLGGLELRSEATVVRYPERYIDARGRQMWETVQTLIAERENTLSIDATLAEHPCAPVTSPSLSA